MEKDNQVGHSPPPYSQSYNNYGGPNPPQVVNHMPPPPGNTPVFGNMQPPDYISTVSYTQPPYNQITPGYNQQYWHTTVVQQPITTVTQVQTRPPDQMLSAVLATICCFLPTGIIAIFKAYDANSKADHGDMVRANMAARWARIWVLITILCGIGVIIFTSVYMSVVYKDFLSSEDDLLNVMSNPSTTPFPGF